MHLHRDELLSQKVWRLPTSALYDSDELLISWADLIPLHEGTRHQRAYLTKSLRGFLLCTLPDSARGEYDASSVLARFRALRCLVRWMIERDIWRLSSLEVDDLYEFIQSRKARNSDDRPSLATLKGWLRLFAQMWVYRDGYSASLRFDPRKFESDILLRARGRETLRYKAIPEESALPLIFDALTWMEDYAPLVTSVAHQYWKIAEKVGVSKSGATKARHKLLVELDSNEHWQEICRMLGPVSRRASTLAKAISHTQAAAIILLLFTAGIRSRELTRLDTDCIVARQENGCEAIYLKGVAAKKHGRQREWAFFEPLASVIRNTRDMFAPACRSDQSPLFVVGNSKLALNRRPTRRILPGTLGRRIREFANASYRRDRPKISRLHPHACRKTFATFVAKRDKRALESLAWQFGHAYAAFTDGVYVGSDFELAEILAEADRQALTTALERLLEAPSLGGKGGTAIIAARDQLRAEGRFRGKRALRSLVEKLISQNVKVAPCDWGYCVYSQTLSACSGSENGPNPIERSPDVCAGCRNFAVTDEYKGWWNERVRRDSEFLKRPNLPEQTVVIVSKQIASGMRVLQELEDKARAMNLEK